MSSDDLHESMTQTYQKAQAQDATQLPPVGRSTTGGMTPAQLIAFLAAQAAKPVMRRSPSRQRPDAQEAKPRKTTNRQKRLAKARKKKQR